MVKPLASVLALSAAISVVFAHAGHALEKRATTPGCSTTYAPVTAYPALDCVPFTQDPQVVNWLKLVDFTKTPTFKPSVVDATTGSTCPPAGTVIPADQCWWTCQKCEAPDDVTTCPTPGTWGLTYDDGPSPDSPRLYDYLKTHNQKATLFVVGSRVVSYPTTLKRAYTEGHHIGIHTWSHTAMTSLTNEQVVAELKWTEKAIVDTIGVTPIYWRPPYGDVDNRVRNIATQLGYKTSIWTMDFDTNDWNIPANITTASAVISTFQAWLPKVAGMKTGFIVLEHDLFPQEVDVAITGILPLAYQQKGLTIVPIAQCRNDAKPYKEGLGTFVLVPNNTTSPSGTNSGPKSSPTGVHSGASGLVPALAGSALAAGSVLAMTLF
ncbi:chitin deacetylase [Dissophora globulifera]|uniref:chitin deacetylase n=1 Tax=Dissophora globulifera TaxID=979702 RepID=A0A9P6RB87_9FUNG|nr:chitin deacetylase [Dissophora globulifera]